MRRWYPGFAIAVTAVFLGFAPALGILPAAALGQAPASAAAEPGGFDAFEASIAAFDAEVARGVAEDAAGCVSVAVFEGDRIVWAKGFGWADMEQRIAATAATIGRTGSISKSFTAVLIAQLAERGVLDLDQAVADHFPEIDGLVERPDGAPAVTYRMLASHTAGLVREPDLAGAASGPLFRWEEKILESIPHTAFQTRPLTEYSYSNIGFGILGLAGSRAAGRPFMELVEELIFEPLGLHDSTFMVNNPEHAARLSVGYSRDRSTGMIGAERATREHFGRGYKVPNGGIYSTVLDLARFAAAMMGETDVEILSVASRREMLTPQPPAAGYGLGFQIRARDGLTTIGHSGSVAGYNAGLTFDPETKLGVAMLRTSGYNPPIEDLLRSLIVTSSR